MKHLNSYIVEKFKITKDIDISNNRGDKDSIYASNWQWFNNLILNVELEEEQLRDMFSNLRDDELKIWIEETKSCYQGTDQEDEVNKIGDDVDLARFYYNNPIKE